MKNKMVFIILTLAVAGKVLAQTDEKRPLSKFALVSTTDGSKGIQLGEDISKAIEAFGQPSGVEDFYYEMDEKMAKLYTFLGNKLYFLDGKLDSFDIVNSSIAIGEKGGSTFKVGEKITTTTESDSEVYTFHDFPIKKRTGVSQNVKYDYKSAVTLTDEEGVVPDAIGFLYFNSNKELIHVSFWMPS